MLDVRSFGRPQFPGGERRGSTLIVLLPLSTLLVAGALAYQAQHAARSHRVTAENVLRDYATFASFELSRIARGRLYEVLGIHLTRLGAGCADRAALPNVKEWVQGRDG